MTYWLLYIGWAGFIICAPLAYYYWREARHWRKEAEYWERINGL